MNYNHKTPWNTQHLTYLIREGEKHTIGELMVEIEGMGFPVKLNYKDMVDVLDKLKITPIPSPSLSTPKQHQTPTIVKKTKVKPRKSKKVAKKKRVYNGFKSHHIEYIRDNIDRLTVSELKVKLMVNLKFPYPLTKIALMAKITELGLTPLPDPPQPTKQDRKESYRKKQKEEVLKLAAEKKYKIIREFYPLEGGEKCKEELAKIKIFMGKPSIYAMAKFLGVKRIREESNEYQPTIPPPTSYLSPPHKGASYIVEDFNEEFGTNFRIFSKKKGGAEVIDNYINKTSFLTMKIAVRLLEGGYVVKKKEGAVLGVWGDVELL